MICRGRRHEVGDWACPEATSISGVRYSPRVKEKKERFIAACGMTRRFADRMGRASGGVPESMLIRDDSMKCIVTSIILYGTHFERQASLVRTVGDVELEIVARPGFIFCRRHGPGKVNNGTFWSTSVRNPAS